ncbi:hypothetical protein K438DRAFT_2000167 [Mycena galopus ATCC 62051]|nr:hypothetical protein K438DRAFT_2000167 [Mycena galopus ATCC 62051]
MSLLPSHIYVTLPPMSQGKTAAPGRHQLPPSGISAAPPLPPPTASAAPSAAPSAALLPPPRGSLPPPKGKFAAPGASSSTQSIISKHRDIPW